MGSDILKINGGFSMTKKQLLYDTDVELAYNNLIAYDQEVEKFSTYICKRHSQNEIEQCTTEWKQHANFLLNNRPYFPPHFFVNEKETYIFSNKEIHTWHDLYITYLHITRNTINSLCDVLEFIKKNIS